MNAFLEPVFILFAASVWSITAAWTFTVSKFLFDGAAPIESGGELLRFTASAYVVSIFLSVILWLGLAPYAAGYDRVVFIAESFIGLAVSAIIAFFVMVSISKEKDFTVPTTDSGLEAPQASIVVGEDEETKDD